MRFIFTMITLKYDAFMYFCCIFPEHFPKNKNHRRQCPVHSHYPIRPEKSAEIVTIAQILADCYYFFVRVVRNHNQEGGET